MLLQGLKATQALDVLHFPTLDDFLTFERLGDSRNTPLSGRCASARAHLALPSIHRTLGFSESGPYAGIGLKL